MAKAANKPESKPAKAKARGEWPAENVARSEISAPLAPMVEGGYPQRHIDVQLNREQAIALRRLTRGLDVTAARLANHRRVITGADAIRWLMESIGASNGSSRNDA